MKYESSCKVFACCGQYIVPTKAVKDKTIVCPRCGAVQTTTLRTPKVLIVKA